MKKKEKERIILQMVYDIESFEEVIDSERPDFLVKYSTEAEHFGVEVTEFYFTESDARLQNIPDYYKELIDEREYRHKDDNEILKVDEIKVINKEDEVVAITDSVIRELPDEKKYFHLILDRITEKNQNVNKYKEGVSHANLIILDRENLLRTLSAKKFIERYFKSSIPSKIVNTGFREIYFITEVKDNGRIYLRLKLLNFFHHFYLFSDFIFADTGQEFIEDQKILKEFAYWLNLKGFETLLKENEEGLEVVCGNYGVIIINGEPKIRDYSDYTLASKAKLLDATKLKSNMSEEFFLRFEDFKNKMSFTTNIASKVFKDYKFS